MAGVLLAALQFRPSLFESSMIVRTVFTAANDILCDCYDTSRHHHLRPCIANGLRKVKELLYR